MKKTLRKLICEIILLLSLIGTIKAIFKNQEMKAKKNGAISLNNIFLKVKNTNQRALIVMFKATRVRNG